MTILPRLPGLMIRQHPCLKKVIGSRCRNAYSFDLASAADRWPRVVGHSFHRNFAELDSSNPKLMNESRIMRIARGCGRPVRDLTEMLEEYKRLAKIWSKMKGLKIPKKGVMSALSRNMNAQHMSTVLPSQMLKQIGGLQSLMKQMGSAKDMMGMFGGGGEK